jgi:hypothetical protein
MTNKNAQSSQAESGANTHSHFADLSANAQRARLLDRLRIGPISTLEARRSLEILAPAPRIKELREMGFPIETLRINQATESGIKHNVALYVLKAGTP